MRCQAHSGHGPMATHRGHTPEQRFCGQWFSCERCHSAVLIPSRQLKALWAEQARKRARAPEV